MIGLASNQILEGRRTMKADIAQPHFTEQPVIDDTRTLYALKMGSEFASGLIYGAGIAGLDEKEIYKCLQKE